MQLCNVGVREAHAAVGAEVLDIEVRHIDEQVTKPRGSPRAMDPH